jgi:hypothetical protein
MINQESPQASFPEVRLDEQRIELGVPVRPRQDGCEADDDALALRHEHVTIGGVLDRQLDRVRIREESVAIARIGERGPPLQRLQARLLCLQRRTDHNVRHPAILSPDPNRSSGAMKRAESHGIQSV